MLEGCLTVLHMCIISLVEDWWITGVSFPDRLKAWDKEWCTCIWWVTGRGQSGNKQLQTKVPGNTTVCWHWENSSGMSSADLDNPCCHQQSQLYVKFFYSLAIPFLSTFITTTSSDLFLGMLQNFYSRKLNICIIFQLFSLIFQTTFIIIMLAVNVLKYDFCLHGVG